MCRFQIHEHETAAVSMDLLSSFESYLLYYKNKTASSPGDQWQGSATSTGEVIWKKEDTSQGNDPLLLTSS